MMQQISAALAGLLMLALSGCTPTVNVAGVYFPGWLVSTLTGVVVSYGLVLWLARRPAARELADSGLFFVSVAAGVALAVWLTLYSGF